MQSALLPGNLHGGSHHEGQASMQQFGVWGLGFRVLGVLGFWGFGVFGGLGFWGFWGFGVLGLGQQL